MGHGFKLIFLSAILWVATACGGATASGGGGEANAPLPEAPEVPIASGPSGSAAQGAPCDFGGAERMTCTAGLVCCYPEQGEVPSGTCTADCPGYD